jgi:hypothetical protein
MLTLTAGPESVAVTGIVAVEVMLGSIVGVVSTAWSGTALVAIVSARLGVGVSKPGSGVALNSSTARRVCSAATVA